MKKSISILAIVFLFISCGEESYWTDEEKSGFLKGCVTGNNKRIEKAGTDPYKQMGITVDEICECLLAKTVEEFPNGSEDKMLMLQAGAKSSQECIEELKD